MYISTYKQNRRSRIQIDLCRKKCLQIDVYIQMSVNPLQPLRRVGPSNGGIHCMYLHCCIGAMSDIQCL